MYKRQAHIPLALVLESLQICNKTSGGKARVCIGFQVRVWVRVRARVRYRAKGAWSTKEEHDNGANIGGSYYGSWPVGFRERYNFKGRGIHGENTLCSL